MKTLFRVFATSAILLGSTVVLAGAPLKGVGHLAPSAQDRCVQPPGAGNAVPPPTATATPAPGGVTDPSPAECAKPDPAASESPTPEADQQVQKAKKTRSNIQNN